MTQNIVNLVSDGVDKAKAGNALEVYTEVARIHDSGSLPSKSHYPFGWIIYYALHQAADSAIDFRKRMLARYLRLDVTKPHKLHSMILTQAIRLYKDAKALEHNQRPGDAITFSFNKFLKLWDTTHLRPGDWRRKEFEGKPMSSTVEKMLTASVDELADSAETPTPEITAILDEALRSYPPTHTLFAQKATVALLSGNKEEGAAFLKKAILSAPTKYYLWARLAELVNPQENLKLHISLLHKALSIPGAEQFKGKIRLSLAKAWISARAYPQALWELNKIRQLYEANGWHLSPSFNKALESIPTGTNPANPEEAYKRVAALAESALYDALPPVTVKKNYHKKPSDRPDAFGKSQPAAWRVADADGKTYWLQPHRFNIRPNSP